MTVFERLERLVIVAGLLHGLTEEQAREGSPVRRALDSCADQIAKLEERLREAFAGFREKDAEIANLNAEIAKLKGDVGSLTAERDDLLSQVMQQRSMRSAAE